MKLTKYFSKSSTLIIFFSIFYILLIEFFSYLYYQRFIDGQIAVFNKEFGWIFQGKRISKDKNVLVSYNYNSTRGNDYLTDKYKEKKKTIFIGDSVVAGTSVTEGKTFVDIFRNKLNSENHVIINAGWPGYTVSQIQKRFIDVFSQVKNIKNVIYVFCVNDIVSDEKTNEIILQTQNKNIELQKQKKYQPYILKILIYYFSLKTQVTNQNTDETQKNYDLGYYQMMKFEPEKKAWDDFKKHVLIIREFLNKKKASFQIVITSARGYYYYHDYQSNLMAIELLKKFASSNNIKIIPLHDKLHIEGTEDLYADYVHYNERGHKFVGDYLYNNINLNNNSPL